MSALQKTWVRIVISLLAGGMTSEIVNVSTGNTDSADSGLTQIMLLGFALIFYLLLTFILKKTGKIK